MSASRILDAGRIAQGFKSQAQLDAAWKYWDHTKACSECGKPGPGVELSDGIQPTVTECDIARELFRQQYA